MFDTAEAGHGTVLDGVTVKGADTCVQVAAGVTGVRLTHLIARDCRVDGVAVAPKGEAAIANATFFANGTAVHATGATAIKNSLLAGNTVALASESPGALVSSFDNLFNNATPYRGLSAGTSDLSTSVTFVDLGARDFRLVSPQPSTDKGDPGDAVGAEPTPNGGRINLGAFGGTADAETSAPSTILGGAGGAPSPIAGPTSNANPPSETAPDAASGCAVGGPAPLGWMPLALAALGVLLARRRRTQRGAR